MTPLWTHFVEPEVYVGGYELRGAHVVVLDEDDGEFRAELLRDLVDVLEHILAGLVVRVRLAREDELHLAARYLDEPFYVCEDEVGALVGRGAAREAYRQHVWVELDSGLFEDECEQLHLRRLVRVPYLVVRDVQRLHEARRVVAPARDVAVVDARERGRGPRRRVDAVRYPVYRLVAEHLAADHRVLVRDAVDVAAELEREVGHREAAAADVLAQYLPEVAFEHFVD